MRKYPLNMELKLIKTDEAYEAILEWIDGQFDLNIPLNSVEGETLQIALLLVKKYEDEHFPMTLPGQTH